MSNGLDVFDWALWNRKESIGLYQRALGQTVVKAKFDCDCIRIEVEDGLVFEVFDDGQSCCEYRYMTCDDDPAILVGGKLTRIAVDDGPNVDDGNADCHEVQFLRIETDKGGITAESHNEHNGYYGGFSVKLREVTNETT